MREIEIKANLREKATLLAVLKEKDIILSAPIVQRDRVFSPETGDTTTFSKQAPWLRIRTETKDGVARHIFNLKKSITNQLDNIEHETEVLDESEMAKIISQLGFVLYSDSTKTRQKANVHDIEICVDTVEGLGDFIEAELLTDESADYNMVIERLWSLLESFGITKVDEVTDGYDVLMRKHQGLDT